MAQLKTRPTGQAVEAFLDGVEPERRRAEARRLDGIFREATGFDPVMWGASIIGYGRYRYTYTSGHGGEFLATGFSPRKAAQVVYIMPGYGSFGALLDRLGKHRKGKSCLYINKLEDVDEAVLRALIRAGLEDLGRHWPVEAE